MRRFTPALLPLFLGACAVSEPAATPRPSGTTLAYAAAGPTTAAYAITDSIRLDMQMLQISIGIVGAVQLSFEPTPQGVRATGRITELSGAYNNPTAGAISVGPSDISGEFVVELDRRGRITTVRLPQMSEAFRQVAGSDNFVQDFFVRLPGSAVQPGATWTDTIRTQDNNEGLSTSTTAIVTSTWTGDSTVAGRRVRVISSRRTTTAVIAGVSQGTEIRQQLNGSIEGTILWDAERNLLIERTGAGQLNGSLEVPGAGVSGVPIRGTVKERMTLRSSASG